MIDRYRNSATYVELAKNVIPGAAQTLSKMPQRFPLGAYPVAVTRGEGARVWDVDDNEYVDWIGALGAVPLGYSNQHVREAVSDAVTYGFGSFSLPHVSELRTAQRLCENIPCAEMVRFVNSGSEATEAAIRTARIATGRDVILTVKNGYHGWHSWFQAVKDWHPGVPKEYEYLIDGFTYNNFESLQEIVAGHSYSEDQHHIAAIIMEPCLFEKPEDGFLEDIRELCDLYGIVLIFDEMVTGYRWALAGGQEYFKVTPDLATFGKGIANGLPIGMLCGKREYMQHAELISGTFGGNAVSLAAASAVLDVYEQNDVIGAMWRRGAELQMEFNNLARNLGIEAQCIGYPCKPKINFSQPEGGDAVGINELRMSLFLQVAAQHGMLWHPGGGNVCHALTDKDMHVTKTAMALGLQSVRNAIFTNDWSELKGEIIKPVVTVRK